MSQLTDELLLNKSPGIDKIPAKVVKDCKIHTVDQLANLINCSLQTCTFPSAWKLAEVIPLMKNDLDAEKGPNNRPISLLPILSKLCEGVAYLQLTTFLTGRGKLFKHQSGNKKLYSTENLNILTTDYIIDQMDKKNLAAMVLMDLSKAFDSISHDILLQKLIKFDISSSAIKWFKSCLEEIFQSVRIGNHLSDPKLIAHGVPQGSILGPLLFSFYVNDLPTIPKSANTESYVDDTKQSKLFKSVNWNNLDNGLKELKWDLGRVTGWCCFNKLLINPKKTKFIIFGTRQLLKNLPDDLSIQFLGEILIPSKSVKDLGVTLDRELTFDEHINNVVKCCNYSLCQISRVRHLFNKEHIEAILNSLVFSKLYFSSTV